MWDNWKLTGQRRKKKHLNLQEILDTRGKNQPSLRRCHFGVATISQDFVQSIKEKNICLNRLWCPSAYLRVI